MNYIQTVLGPVEPPNGGVVLLHEHVLSDLTCLYSPPAAGEGSRSHAPLSLNSLGWVRMHPYNALDNLRLQDVGVAERELSRFRAAGGALMVDVTSASIGRDPRGLCQVSRASGVPIVMGCGYYVSASHPRTLEQQSVDDLAAEMIAEIQVGVGGTGVRAGVIGELGLSGPAHDGELKCLRAAAIAQQETGATIVVHSPSGSEGPFAAAAVLAQMGADPARVAISHLDARFGEDIDAYLRLADQGFVLSLDTFGRDIYIDFMRTQLPNDTTRIGVLKALCAYGLSGQIVLSQDICLKMELSSYGGYGYGHILENLWPRLLDSGLEEDALNAMLHHNPIRLLQSGK